MSWLTFPPAEIISSLNIITEALNERFSYMLPTYHRNYKYLTRPCSAAEVKYQMKEIADGIKILYREHFPVKNFGRWAYWKPYKDLDTDAKIGPAVSAELAAAEIDPQGLIWDKPHRIADVNFIRACYYLLNNILLYCVDRLYKSGRTHVLEWGSESRYDNNDPIVDMVVDNLSDFDAYAAVGYRKINLRCVLNRYFYQSAFHNGMMVTPALTGAWKGRYTTSISKALLYPQTENVQEFGEEYDIPGTHEINFFGTQGDDLPWFEDITKDLAYYKCWGNFQYGYTMSRQSDTLTEILLTKDNFTPPNYKYLDVLE